MHVSLIECIDLRRRPRIQLYLTMPCEDITTILAGPELIQTNDFFVVISALTIALSDMVNEGQNSFIQQKGASPYRDW